MKGDSMVCSITGCLPPLISIKFSSVSSGLQKLRLTARSDIDESTSNSASEAAQSTRIFKSLFIVSNKSS